MATPKNTTKSTRRSTKATKATPVRKTNTDGAHVIMLDTAVEAKVRSLITKNPDLTRSGAVKAFRAAGASASQRRIHAAYDVVTKAKKATRKPTRKAS